MEQPSEPPHQTVRTSGFLKTCPPHGSEKPEMATSETWEDFESALTSVLLDLEEREMITIKLAGGKEAYSQNP